MAMTVYYKNKCYSECMSDEALEMCCKPRLQGKAGLRERVGRTTDSQKEPGVESECRGADRGVQWPAGTLEL